MKPEELNIQFAVLLEQLSAEELKSYMKSLSADTLFKIITKLDIDLIKAIQIKAKIGDQNTFVQSLPRDKHLEPVIYEEVGRAKDSKKEFNRHIQDENKPVKDTSERRPAKIILSHGDKSRVPGSKRSPVISKQFIADENEKQDHKIKSRKPRFDD